MTQLLTKEPEVSKIAAYGIDFGWDPLYREARILSEHKIAKAMGGSKFLGEEDDLDIEGERILTEIKQFKKDLVKRHFFDGEV